MGQGYMALVLSESNPNQSDFIRTWVNPHYFQDGYKLTEHSWIGNHFVEAVEYLISPLGIFYKSRVVWAGDYADPEPEEKENLCMLSQSQANSKKCSFPPRYDMSVFRYIVNHTKGQYVDKEYKFDGSRKIHPLPLLTAEGNGRGGGDYYGTDSELVGSWARHVLSMEIKKPDGYSELICEFS
jgi:hypothetical protein